MVGGRRGQQTSQLDEIAVIIIVFPGVCILIQFDIPHLLVFLMWPFLGLVSSTANVYIFLVSLKYMLYIGRLVNVN